MQEIQTGFLDRHFDDHHSVDESGELESADRVASVARVSFADEIKPSPAADSHYWREQHAKLERKYIQDISSVNATVTWLRIDDEKKSQVIKDQQDEITSLKIQNARLMELLKPYVNEILENITKCLIQEIAKCPEAVKQLRKSIGDKEEVTPRDVITMLEPILQEAMESQLASTDVKEPEDYVALSPEEIKLEVEVEKLRSVITLLNLKQSELEQQIPVAELELGSGASSSSAVSYLGMTGTGAKTVGHILWSGTKMSGRFAWWVCRNLVPLLTCGMVSAVVLESPWTPILMLLLRGI